MRRLIFFILILTISNFALAQNPAGQIEILPYIRMDWYPEFSYKTADDNPNTYYVKIQGSSWGINVNYKLPLKNKNFYAKMGLGYYRCSFNKMHNHSTLFGSNQARIIGYPSNIDIIFVTDKYWYNTISVNMGIEKSFNISRSMQIISGINLKNYFTYSQYYHIPFDYPTGPPHHKYKTNDVRYFGLSAIAHVDLLKTISRIAIGPSIILPVFGLWKGDKIFPEENNLESRSKWFRGIGVGISLSYSLTQKNN